LEASGAKVGLTVSPHVDEVNERVQINHEPLNEVLFCSELDEYVNLVDASGIRPSYFELMIAFAYWEFARQQVDYAVIEVGFGGLLDRTNVISRSDKVCIITDIGLDHTEVLGDTIDQIAVHKAGIIQPYNHVFMYKQAAEVMAAVELRCQQKNARLTTLEPEPVSSTQPSLPLFQQRNFRLASKTVGYVLSRDGLPLPTNSQLHQAASVYIPARMEIVTFKNKTVIVDGSHNGQKITALAESIHAAFPKQKVAALVSFVNGPEDRWQRGIDVLHKITDDITVTTFSAEQDVPKRSIDPAVVAQYCEATAFSSVTVEENPRAAFDKVMGTVEPIILVVGSFYLLNDIRPLLSHVSTNNKAKPLTTTASRKHLVQEDLSLQAPSRAV